MKDPRRLSQILILMFCIGLLVNGCTSSANSRYFGKTVAPKDNILRYVSGSEPETLDPHISSGQPEARIYMAIYEGLVEYGPKDMQPIPAIAKSWEISSNVDEFVFHLRDNAKWSDGTPITANDFVYSFRRGFAADTLSSSTELGFFIKYAEAFNGGQVFVKKGDTFLLAKDFSNEEQKPSTGIGPDTDFHKFVQSPIRLTLDGDEKKRAKQIDADPKLKAAVAGAEFVPVKAEDLGVEAIDNYTLRVTLRQPAPFFIGLLAHQFFRLVPKQAIDKWGKEWTRKEHIVTCGAFRIKEIRPYDALILEKDPNYWDAANVHLDGIAFYPVEDNATILNLYKGGSIDAFLNHTVLTSWIEQVRAFKDEYMNFPENSTAYYSMNVTRPPFNDPKVRKAFAMAVDNDALSNFRKITKPLYDLTPTGIFPDYDKARAKVSEEIRKERNIAPDVWAKYGKFDAERARKTLTEAGFPVQKSGDGWACPTFPTDKVSLMFNTNESNRSIAEFVQAQWRQNLGITVPLKSQEFKTFLKDRHEVQYDGLAQSLWSGDYMDPYTFVGLHYGYPNNGDAGFNDPKYNKMLDDANAELDPAKRYEMLARAEFYLMEQQPSIPLTINATNWMKKPYVKGMYPNPGTLLPWKFVYIEQDPAKWDKDVENVMTESDPQVDKQLQELTATQKTAK
ncbi:MAG: peptide ABC transporter substrate-binding protein [Pyrinomonadaceae bacterium]